MKTKKISIVLLALVLLLAQSVPAVLADKDSFSDGSWKARGPHPDITVTNIFIGTVDDIKTDQRVRFNLVMENKAKIDYPSPFFVDWHVDGNLVLSRWYDGSIIIRPGETRIDWHEIAFSKEGIHNIRAKVYLDPILNLYSETKIKDNEMSINVTVLPGPKPDLVISLVKYDGGNGIFYPTIWDPIGYAYIIQNIGEGSFKGPMTISMKLGNEVIYEKMYDNNFMLNSGEGYADWVLTDRVFDDHGTQALTVEADSNNNVSESNETNNAKTKLIIVSQYPVADMSVEEVSYYGGPNSYGSLAPLEGDPAGVRAQIKNTGQVPIDSMANVRVNHNGNLIIDWNDVLVKIEPGQAQMIELVSYEDFLRAGENYFTFEISSSLQEMTMENNYGKNLIFADPRI